MKTVWIAVALAGCSSPPVEPHRSISPLGTITLASIAAWAASCTTHVKLSTDDDRVFLINCVVTTDLDGWEVRARHHGYVDAIMIYAPDRSGAETRARGLLEAHVAPGVANALEASLASGHKGPVDGMSPPTKLEREWPGMDDISVIVWTIRNPE